MTEFQDKLDWRKISQYQVLTAPFIRDFSHLLDMKLVSRYQTLDMGAIEALKDQLDLKNIFKYQELSDSFVLEHVKELEGDDICDSLILNMNLSQTVVNAIYKRWVLLYLQNICKKKYN